MKSQKPKIGKYERTYYIYKILNKVNGKFYIGSTSNYDFRWKQHIKQLNDKTHINYKLKKDWKEYGQDNFEFSILEEFKGRNQYVVEQEYLDELQPFDEVGYNIQREVIRREKTIFCSECREKFTTTSNYKTVCPDCISNYYDSIGIRTSRYDLKPIEEWDEDDHYACWWDDAMEK